jgi:hypothetical protein
MGELGARDNGGTPRGGGWALVVSSMWRLSSGQTRPEMWSPTGSNLWLPRDMVHAWL